MITLGHNIYALEPDLPNKTRSPREKGEREKTQVALIRQQECLALKAALDWDDGMTGEQATILRERIKRLREDIEELRKCQLLDLEELCLRWLQSEDSPNVLADKIVNFSYLADSYAAQRRRIG